DSAMYWFENYQIDGFRHDATKHIPESFWKTLTRKTKERIILPEQRAVYQIGETYGSPELISSYVSSGQLDGQFDFNLYDAMVRTFAMEDESFDNLVKVLKQSMKYYGAHHKMGNISGNQDRARFASYADGAVNFNEDPKLAGWTRDIEPIGENGHKRSEMLHAFLLTVPGIPCIYYGDEIAMPGANDPDNRRMMHFNDWNELEQETFQNMASLIDLRSNRMSLLYGDLKVEYQSDNVLVFTRSYLGERTTCIFTKNAESYGGNDNAVLRNIPGTDWQTLAESDSELFGSGMHYRIVDVK
ncbi:MAG: alpha-amylase family glycosyl hydrolase, partial [Flavobacteriales bacterium]